MADSLPKSITSSLHFENGTAIGLSNRWIDGQYCSIITPIGIVGCGIYDVVVPAKFNQALAVAEGTPECPLVNPEDLLDAEIARCTPRATEIGIKPGMKGREAVEKMLKASPT
ncbi:MAG: YunC family protein [Pseudomonadales bacterium]|nr:YunC family protein [Pseudomonadales bacterium]|tara:strand:- start:108 stop:446 length:339 start_codon:yes stop_codon:yes gene_type:complete